MSREKVLIKNTIIYALGSFFSRFLNFLVIPIYTNFLTVRDYGYFDLITTTISLLLPLVTFQINDGLYRYMLESETQSAKKEVVSSSIFIIFRNLIIFIIIYILTVSYIEIKYDYLILVYFTTFVMYDFLNQVARALRENLIYVLSGILNTILTLSFTIMLLMITDYGVAALLFSMSVSMVLAMFFTGYKINIFSYIEWNSINKELKSKLISYSVPLIPNIINWWVMNISDRYLLTLFIGLEANGIYAIANKISSILLVFNSVFYLAWQETAITEYNSEDRNEFYTKMFNKYLVFQVAVFLVLLSVSKSLVSLFVDEKFHEAVKYLPFLYLGAIFSAFSSFYGTGYQSAKDTKGAFYSSVYGSIINILINLVAIPVIGIQAAALSTMLAFLTMWLIRIYQTRKYFNIDINRKNALISLIIIIISILLYYKYSILLPYFMTIIIIFFLYLNYKNLITLYSQSKKYKGLFKKGD